MKLAQTISRFIEMANCAECKTDPDGPVTDTNEVPDVRFNEIETSKIDDSVLFSLLRHQLATVQIWPFISYHACWQLNLSQ